MLLHDELRDVVDAYERLKQRAGAPPVRISILGSVEHNFFTNGSVELFDCSGQGRIDAFFLGGGQIDGHGNINLVGIGDYPVPAPRWPGSFGSAYLYFVVPRVILFREALLRRAAAGAGVLVSSHHLDEVARVAHRITVINAGRLIGALDPGVVDIERAFFTLVHRDDEQRAEQP